MNRLAVLILLPLMLAGCLKDGRSEADFLAEYARLVDVELPSEPDMSVSSGTSIVVRDEATSGGCSTAEPPTTDYVIALRNEHGSIVQVFFVDPANGCAEVLVKQIHLNSFNSVPGWDGALYRVRDELGTLQVEIEGGSATETQEVIIP